MYCSIRITARVVRTDSETLRMSTGPARVGGASADDSAGGSGAGFLLASVTA